MAEQQQIESFMSINLATLAINDLYSVFGWYSRLRHFIES